MSTGQQQSDDQYSQQEVLNNNEDLTPQNANSKLPTEQLTSFSRKKSFEVQDEKHEELLNEEEFLMLEKQISSQQNQQRPDNFAQEETKSRRSENQSMKGVSFATSDTEEKKSEYIPTPTSRKPKKKRLSKVEEELKQINNPLLKESQSEHYPANKSNATSVRETKSNKKKEESKQNSQMLQKKTESLSQSGANNQVPRKSNDTSKRKIIDQSHHKDNQPEKPNPFEALNAQMTQMMQQNPMMMQMLMLQSMAGGFQALPQFPFNPFQAQFQQQPLNLSQQNPLLTPQSNLTQQNLFNLGQSGYNSNPQFQPQLQLQNQAPSQSQTMMDYLEKIKIQGQLPVHLQDIYDQYVQLKNQVELIQQENQALEEEIQKQSEFEDQIVSDSLNQQINQRRMELQEEKQLSQTSQKLENNDEPQKDDKAKRLKDNEQELSTPKINIPLSEDQRTEESKPVIDGQSEMQKVDELGEQKETSEENHDHQGAQHVEALNIQEPMNEQDQVLKEVALMAARGYDPTAELEKENADLEEQLQSMMKQEKESFMKVRALEYENEILFGKSNSMDHSIQNYGKRLEELGKQVDELNAILRIKDQEMIEMTNDIHTLKVLRENLRKELGFRKQRQDQLESNLRRVTGELERAQYDQDDIQRSLDADSSELAVLKEESKRLKSMLERVRQELVMDEQAYDQMKQKVNEINLSINQCESQMFSAKNQIDRLRNEKEQIKVELSYAKATVENQRQAQEKLQIHYQKQMDANNQLDFQRQALTLNEGELSSASQQPILQSTREQKQQKENTFELFESDKRVTFQADSHRRSSSQDKKLVQVRNFQNAKSIKEEKDVRLDQISAHNSSRIKTILFDLSAPQSAETSSITGQKRRGGVTSQTREGQTVNRNFVHQMSNILVWNQQDAPFPKNTKQREESFERSAVTKKADQSLSFKERYSMPETLDQSLRFGREQKTQQNMSYNQSMIQQGEDDKPVKRDLVLIKQMKDDLNVFQQRREKINAEINKVSDKTRDGEEKRNSLENEMKALSKKIGDIKLQLRKMDALKNNL